MLGISRWEFIDVLRESGMIPLFSYGEGELDGELGALDGFAPVKPHA
jgi:hypothetical protein